ncbi:MAG: hypothetical protein AAGD22_04315 [Verrucomicrobiota bacterium]
MKLAFVVFAFVIGFAGAAKAAVIFDDFNDGNDVGWTRVDPIALATGGTFTGGNWSFPNGNSYEVAGTPESPSPGTLGTARAYSLRLDETYSDTVMSWEVLDWTSGNGRQAFGGLARVGSPGPGTTSGYGFFYGPSLLLGSEGIAIFRIDNEIPTVTLGSLPLDLTSGTPYQFVFSVIGEDLRGQVFDITNPGSPQSLGIISGFTDSTYASGNTGLFVGGAGVNYTTAATTFDNYFAAPEPSGALLLMVGATMPLLRRRRCERVYR